MTSFWISRVLKPIWLTTLQLPKAGVNLSQNFADSAVNIAALIAKKHQVTLIDEDKLPAGTYTGVVKPSDWPAGEATLKTLAAWSTPGSVFTVRSLRLIDVTVVT